MVHFFIFLRKGLPVFFLFAVQICFAQAYNYYYGNIHAHSAYSDGNLDSMSSNLTTPAQDFGYAQASYHFDFLGISDHNHNTVGMTRAKYHAGVAQAIAATTGSFVALYGMEYGVISNGGHVLIYGIDSLIGWQPTYYDIFNSQYNYSTLWGLVNARPDAFASLAHPQTTDYTNLSTAAYSSTADQAIAGVSIRSGYSLSTTTNYSDNPATLYDNYFQTLLSKGYHVAPSIDHDNHNTTFGRTLHGRTVVLAPALTKSDILSAVKNMRYYASDDWNVQASFTIGGNVLGSIVQMNADPNISVNITDPDLENVSKIEIYYGTPGSGNLPTVLTLVNNSASLNYTHTLAVGQTRYYFAKITQSDGDLIWTAPIWVTRITGPLPIELMDWYAKADHRSIHLYWTATITTPTVFEIERSEDGVHFTPIGSVAGTDFKNEVVYTFIDSTVSRGLHFYRLRQKEVSGAVTFSSIISAVSDGSPLRLSSVQPNPASGLVRCVFVSDTEMQMHWSLYNMDGQLLKTAPIDVFIGENTIETDLAALPNGVYLMTIGTDSQCMTETQIIKR